MYLKGKTAESEDELILLLNKLQSLEVRRPRLESEAEGRLKRREFAVAVMEKSTPEVEEAKVMVEAVVVELPLPSAVRLPEPEVMHTPFTEKHPAARLMPPVE